MNPSARPWYPPGEVALDVQVPAVRRQNNPYHFSAVQQPPTPLCGDADLSDIQRDVLTAAPAAMTCSTRGPYRSTALMEQTVPALLEARRHKPLWAFTNWTSETTPLQLSSGTPSSMESQGDSQEATFTHTEEACFGAASTRVVVPKVSIPLPRSQRIASQTSAGTLISRINTNNNNNNNINNSTKSTYNTFQQIEAKAAVKAKNDNDNSDTRVDLNIPSIKADAIVAAEITHSAIKNNNDEIENSNYVDDLVKEEKDDEDEDEDNTANDITDAAQSSSEEVSTERKWKGNEKNRQTSSISGPTGNTKKPKPKVKREEKWTIVQGKVNTIPTGIKRFTPTLSVVNVRENGAIIRLPDLHPVERARNKQIQQNQQQQQKEENFGKDETIIESKTKRQRETRRARGNNTDDELLETLVSNALNFFNSSSSVVTGGSSFISNTSINGSNGSSGSVSVSSTFIINTSSGTGEGQTTFAIVGVPLASVSQSEQLLPESQVTTRQKNAFRIFLRSLALSETSNAKTLLLQRALQGLPETSYHQCPKLVCAILLETSDSCVDVEKSLHTCYKALQLAEKHNLEVFEMLSRLAITRTFARVIDTMDARVNLTRAATIAIARREKAALGWIAMQMGVTLEISGLFPESLAWYSVAERLASVTGQQQLLCDIHCCQSIAYSAVGEVELARRAYEASRLLLPLIPRHRHQRPLQNYAQMKCQLGDMHAALQLQETELEIAKEAGDTHAISRCMGAIALTKRFLCRYDEAAENHMEELCVHNAHDPRQAVESLTGAAACWRLGGHLQKAYDYCMRALRQAQQCQDLTTLAKALVELAEVELSMNLLEKAQQHLHETLTTISRVDEAEQKQYLVKAALCEVEWRCCSILEQVHFRRGEFFEALQCSDRCHVPNTAHVARLLLRRQRRSGVILEAKDTELVTKSAVEKLLRRPSMRGWKIVCYSLPWIEGLDFMAYVLGLDNDGNLTCVCRPLQMQEELVAFICAPNALSKLLDAPMYTEDGERIYGDTPLWPQLYSKVAFEFQQCPENSGKVESLSNDPLYCLRLLYESFIKPLEEDINDSIGLTFVGDGVFSRLPFHAFYDGQRYLAERYCSTTCCSMALLCTHSAEEEFAISTSVTTEEEKEGDSKKNSSLAQTSTRYCTVIDDASGSVVLLDDFLAKTAKEENNNFCVRRVVVDADVVTAVKDCEKETLATVREAVSVHQEEQEEVVGDVSCGGDVEVAATRELLRRLHRREKVTSVRNSLYTAVHEETHGVLELRLRALPEVKEDFCGAFIGSQRGVLASHSGEVANTWELRGYSLVVCTGAGTYGGLSIHETGIPVYRALQYAGARRLLLPIGSRRPACPHVAAAAIAASLQLSSSSCGVAGAVREAQLQCIAQNIPLEDWAAFTLVGLPSDG